MHHVGGAAGGDMFAFGPPPLGPRRCVPAGILPAGLAGVIDGWLAAGGSAGACFCVRACWQMSERWLVFEVDAMGCARVTVCSAVVVGVRDRV